MTRANTQGLSIGNIKGLKCPKCGQHLIKSEGKCDCEYTCFNPDCRGSNMDFPIYYGYTQRDIDNNTYRDYVDEQGIAAYIRCRRAERCLESIKNLKDSFKRLKK